VHTTSEADLGREGMHTENYYSGLEAGGVLMGLDRARDEQVYAFATAATSAWPPRPSSHRHICLATTTLLARHPHAPPRPPLPPPPPSPSARAFLGDVAPLTRGVPPSSSSAGLRALRAGAARPGLRRAGDDTPPPPHLLFPIWVMSPPPASTHSGSSQWLHPPSLLTVVCPLPSPLPLAAQVRLTCSDQPFHLSTARFLCGDFRTKRAYDSEPLRRSMMGLDRTGAPAWSKWPSWRGHGWPPRAPQAALEGLRLAF